MNKTSAPTPEPSLSLTGPCPPDVTVRLQVREYPIKAELMDEDALKVVRRLVRYGHEAYLVGGCVRDILLGQKPKDFDVATSARPNEVKRLFRNCRLIGRRFRLAHLHFRNQKIIEVATFRREPNEKDDLTDTHAAGNLFGAAADDAIRRDFTINALMYDVANKRILDWTGGLEDVETGVVRAIGHPDRRIPEDPVRIIRAIKFATRLDLAIDPVLEESSRQHAALMKDCSPARLVEELFKILRSGCAVPTLEMLAETGVLAHILPGLAAHVEANPSSWYRTLEITDDAIAAGAAISDVLVLASLFYPACEATIWDGKDVAKAVGEKIDSLCAPMAFTRRHIAIVRSLFASLRRTVGGPRTKRIRRILDREYAVEAIEMLRLSGRGDKDVVQAWEKLLRQRSPADEERRSPPRRRRRPRRPPRDRTPPQTS